MAREERAPHASRYASIYLCCSVLLTFASDIVDYIEPVMLIVGSRGLGNLKGSVRVHCSELSTDAALGSILLGSTSHYLIQVRAVHCVIKLATDDVYRNARCQ